MMYYKIYHKFKSLAEDLASIELRNEKDHAESDRNDIYNRLRLPIKHFTDERKDEIDSIIQKHINITEKYNFSIIESNGVSQIHTDTSYKKDAKFQRYCNLAFPISGDLTSRITYWPKLDKQDSIHCFKHSYVQDSSLEKYRDESSWNAFISHELFRPVLLNTSLPHGVVGEGKTLFAYITLIGKSYEDCVDLYDSMSSSATI